jgi:hypothetical protein
MRQRLRQPSDNTHVRKNVEAFGRFVAKIDGTPDGFFFSWGRALMIPDATETTRKPF